MDALGANWPMIKALMGGTSAMRKAGKALLPQWPNEDDNSYKTRLATATLHPVFRRTTLVNAARPFAKAPSVNAPGINPEWLDDVDRQGSTLAAFANTILINALAYGLCGVLVDYPQASNVKTKADEQTAKVRPYLVQYAPQSILGWKMQGQNLAQLRLLESVEVDDGAWGSTTIEQVRVLTPGRWQTYRQAPSDPQTWVLFDEGATTLQIIPFVFFYGLRLGFGNGQTPLLDLAFQNVEHYQSSSDQQTILHVARVPVLVAKGFGDAEITIGASSAVTTDNPEATLSYTEHTGAAIGAGRQSLLDLEERMRATGAELISQKQAQTTATQVNAEGEASKSTLQQIVEVLEESFEAVIELMGAWVGKTVDVEIEFFKQFSGTPPAEPQALAAAATAGVISKQTAFEELQRRDILAPDLTWEGETQRMKSQKPDTPPPIAPNPDQPTNQPPNQKPNPPEAP